MNCSAPLARKAPLKRTRMKRRPRRRKATKAEKAFMAMVAEQRCVLDHDDECKGCVKVHHHGRKGMGQCVSHFRTVPLCKKHHDEWHDKEFMSGWILTREEVDLMICRESIRLLVMWAESAETF